MQIAPLDRAAQIAQEIIDTANACTKSFDLLDSTISVDLDRLGDPNDAPEIVRYGSMIIDSFNAGDFSEAQMLLSTFAGMFPDLDPMDRRLPLHHRILHTIANVDPSRLVVTDCAIATLNGLAIAGKDPTLVYIKCPYWLGIPEFTAINDCYPNGFIVPYSLSIVQDLAIAIAK